MPRYGLPEVREFLKSIAKENAEYVYFRPDWRRGIGGEWIRTGCSYVHTFDAEGNYLRESTSGRAACLQAKDKYPGCIIGKMLIENMGLSPDWFLEDYNRGGTIRGIQEHLEEAGITFTYKAMAFMAAVQQLQDDGYSWGNAVNRVIRDM